MQNPYLCGPLKRENILKCNFNIFWLKNKFQDFWNRGCASAAIFCSFLDKLLINRILWLLVLFNDNVAKRVRALFCDKNNRIENSLNLTTTSLLQPYDRQFFLLSFLYVVAVLQNFPFVVAPLTVLISLKLF